MKDNGTSGAGQTLISQARCEANPPCRILVVDDDVDIRRFNAETLLQSGYDVDGAEDGVEAWNMLQLNTYDLLVTDNNMPKMSGVELLKKLHAASMEMPTIMASGTLPNEQFTQCPWLQSVAMLPKPFTSDELLGTVEKALRVTDSSREQFGWLPIWQNKPAANALRL